MPTSNRDKVIAAIYDSVIRPESYADFMDLWGDHICEAMETAPEPLDTAGQSDALGIDPVLTEHFTRALMILDQLGRQKPRQSLKEEVAQSETWMLLLGRGSRVLAQSRVAQDWLGGQPLQERLNPHGAELMEALLGRAMPRLWCSRWRGSCGISWRGWCPWRGRPGRPCCSNRSITIGARRRSGCSSRVSR